MAHSFGAMIRRADSPMGQSLHTSANRPVSKSPRAATRCLRRAVPPTERYRMGRCALRPRGSSRPRRARRAVESATD